MATDEEEKAFRERCRLLEQGFSPASCAVWHQGRRGPACRVTLKWEGGKPYRLIKTAHLSRPEHYFSIYQSGCNWSCKKCHSWEFTQHATGAWMSPQDIAGLAREYAHQVTYKEPKERATAFHALDLCRSCGVCVELAYLPLVEAGQVRGKPYLVPTGRRSNLCPKRLQPEQMLLSPQGLGPARNIIAFTGGDLACQPEFYALCAEKIKGLDLGLWVLLETNGYGLTPQNLDLLQSAGIDAFWLDIKAYDREVHHRLTGASNEWVLRLPEEMLKRGFILEILSLYIPGWVERDQIERIAVLLAQVDKNIPFTILAFFPQHEMRHVPPPELEEMVSAYEAARAAGLRQVRLGNLGVFARTEQDYKRLAALAPGGW
ncbi:MAG TPA: radical SAM protein [Dehalococcoidia bacterium]|jgi:pyruvate-formate lyase-activating enzyme|nr:radical SAM protein [Dehalococcoidia bacterium]